jgi:hypothetical protein
MEFDLAGQGESEPTIQLDGVMIFGADMEPGHQAFTTGTPLPPPGDLGNNILEFNSLQRGYVCKIVKTNGLRLK